MPYRDDQTRTRAYSLGVLPDNVRAAFASKLPLMQDLQESTQAQIVALEIRIREKLDDMGVLGSFRISYLNFGRALFRAKGSQSGVALQKVATAEKAKFVSYGLDPEILDEIIYFAIGEAGY